MVIYSMNVLPSMSQDIKLLRVKIFDQLSKIVDPEINTSIVELELIDEVDINDSNVKVDLHLTSPFCPAVFGFKICQDVHDYLLKVDGVEDVKVNVSNHFMAEQINNQVNNSPNPKKIDELPKKIDELPKKIDELPKKIDELPKKID